MATYFKNISGNTINVEIFGVGKLHIPAEAQSVEIEPSVADAINEMVKPNKALEMVSASKSNPVVLSAPVDGTVNEPSVDMDKKLPPAIDYASLTNKQLKALCEVDGILVHRNANKAELLDLLGVGESVEQ